MAGRRKRSPAMQNLALAAASTLIGGALALAGAEIYFRLAERNVRACDVESLPHVFLCPAQTRTRGSRVAGARLCIRQVREEIGAIGTHRDRLADGSNGLGEHPLLYLHESQAAIRAGVRTDGDRCAVLPGGALVIAIEITLPRVIVVGHDGERVELD